MSIGSVDDAAVFDPTDSATVTSLLKGLLGGGGGPVPDYSQAPVQVSLSTSTARSTQLAVGWYLIKSDARVFVRQGAVTVDATVTTDWVLEANVEYPMYVSNTTTLGYLAGILSTGTGTLNIQAAIA